MRNGFRHLLTAETSRVLRSFAAPTLVCVSALSAGCSDSGNKASGPPPLTNSDTVNVEQAMNFTSTSKLTIPPVTVPPATNLNVCWDQLSKDIQGHAVDPTKDINDVSLIKVLSTDPMQVADMLNKGELVTGNIKGDWEKQFPTGTGAGKACIHLADLVTVPAGPNATPFDPKSDFVTDPTVTYLMVFASGTAIGFGARTMVILQTDPSSTTSDVTITNTTATLEYSATLAKNDPLPAPKADPALRVDWSNVMTGGGGQEIGKNDVSRVLIGFYKDMQPADLEKNFLNLQQPTGTDTGSPTLSWEAPVQSGQSVALSTAMGRKNEGAFTGFDSKGDTGSWIMGMFCDSCQNPAPVIVTLVAPQ